jgi:acetyl esterase/lipase
VKRIFSIIAFCAAAVSSFAQTSVDKIDTRFDDGTWGDIIPRGSVNLPATGSYPSSTINGFRLNKAVMYGSNMTCPKGGTHTVSIALDKQKEGSSIGLPPVKRMDLIEVHASSGSVNMGFVLEEKVSNSWKAVKRCTTKTTDSIFLIEIERSSETALRISNATNSGLFIYKIATRTREDINRVNISKHTPGEGSIVSANRCKNIIIEFDKNVMIGSAKPTLNGLSVNPDVDGKIVNIPVLLEPNAKYILNIPTGAFTDPNGVNPNLEAGINFSTYRAVPVPEGFSSHLDVVYKTVADWEGRMDLYLPPKGDTPTAIAINMHGGGWNHGEKEQNASFWRFFDENIAIANVEYRLTPQAEAPAAVEDVRCAMHYIINNATRLNVDANKIAFMGSSAGAHLALMAGYLQNNNTYDSDCNNNKKFKIVAVLDRYAPTQLDNFFSYGSVVSWLGGENIDLAKKMSPLCYVEAKTPPTFIVHGNADATIPYSHSTTLYDSLIKAGVNSEFITVEGGGHGGFPADKSNEVEAALVKFLVDVLSQEDENENGNEDENGNGKITSIERNSSKKISVYPNPTKEGHIYFSSEVKINNVHIYNLQGQLVKFLSDPYYAVDISELSYGTYFIHFSFANGEGITKKIIYTKK